MDAIEVDPPILGAAGKTLSGYANEVAAALTAFSGALKDFNAGQDKAGMVFAFTYSKSAPQLAKGSIDTLKACDDVGFGIQMSASNYAQAEAYSTVSNPAPSVAAPAEMKRQITIKVPSPMGSGIAEPALWSVVQFFINGFWPNGDPDAMRPNADAWKTLGDALTRISGQIPNAKNGVSSQDIPEKSKINTAIDQIAESLKGLGEACKTLGEQLGELADEVEKTQDSIRDLLKELSPSGLLDTIGDVLSGDNPLDKIKEIAHDIMNVLRNLGRQAEAAVQAIEQMMSQLEEWLNQLEEWTKKNFPAMAPIINGYLDLEFGILKNIVGMVSIIPALNPMRFFYNPQGALQAWKGTAEGLLMLVSPPFLLYKIASDPHGALEMGKALIAWDDLTGDHPMRGVGYNLATIATFFIPGGAAAKPGIAAAEAGTRAARIGGMLARATGADTAIALVQKLESLPKFKLGGMTHINPGELRVGEFSRPGQLSIRPGEFSRPGGFDGPHPGPSFERPGPSSLSPTGPHGPDPHPGLPAAEPKAGPAPAATHPTTPGEHPSVPGERPATPTATHPTPGEHPSAPAATHPTTPGEHPSVPGERPATPTATHPTPGEHPSAPAATHPSAPGERPAAPAATHPSAPGERPAAPAATHPSAPGERPAAPAATHPSAPGERPAAPAATHPSAPGERPAAPAATHPSAPGERPAAPAATHPSAPGERPAAPAATHPSAPGERPAAPAADRPHPADPGNDLPGNDNGAAAQAQRDAGVGDRAHDPNSSNEPRDQCVNGEPVDMATGEYSLPMVDVELPGVLPLVLRRQHRSQFRWGVWFGPSWTSTFDARVVVTEAAVTTIDADGTMLQFPHPTLGEPARPIHGRNWLLFHVPSGGYRLFSEDVECSYFFEPKEQLHGVDLAVGNISISAITDRHQNRILFGYNDNGLPAAIVHSGGYWIDVHTDGRRITGYDLGDPQGGPSVPLRRFGYIGEDLHTVTDGCGATTSFAYDQHHQMVAWMDSAGARYQNTYDEQGRVTSQQGTDGVWSGTFDYMHTSEGQVSTYADAYGAETVYELDADSRPVRVMDAEGRVITTAFNKWRDPLTVIDQSGDVTRYTYTEHGDINQVIDPLGTVTAIEYERPHRPNLVAREGQPPVVLAYDASGNVTSVTSEGAIRRYEYSATGAVTAMIDEEGRRTQMGVNAAGLPTRITDDQGHASQIDYDMFGRVIAVADPQGRRTRLVRDTEGRVLQRIAADGTVQSWEYDGEGNCVRHIDPMGARTQYEYGFYDKPTAQIAPDGSRTEFRYDLARRLIEVVNPQGLSWRYSYYRDGRLKSETDFNGATTSYRYDAAGRLAEKTNAEGQSITYRYDAAGRPTAEITDAATDSDPYRREVTRYTYGPNDAVAEAVNIHGSGTYRHDSQLQISRETWNQHTVVANFNAAGQPIAVQSPSGVLTEYSYDSRGMLATVISAGRVIDLTTDAAGWITRTSLGRTNVDREFDPLGRLLAQTWTGTTEGQLSLGTTGGPRVAAPDDAPNQWGEHVLTTSSYAYQPDGALTAITTRQLDRTGRLGEPLCAGISLDILGRITKRTLIGDKDLRNTAEETVERYSYDPANNITSATTDGPTQRAASASTKTAEQGDQWQYRGTLLVADGRSRYTYDRAGRLIRTVTKHLNRKPDVWHYSWDAYDRLRTATNPDGTIWTYGYDAASRRTHKTNTATGESTTFSWLGNQLLEQNTPQHRTSPENNADDIQVPTAKTITWTYLPGAITPLAQTHTTNKPDTGPSSDTQNVDVPLRISGSTIPVTADDAIVSRPQQWAQSEIDRAFYAIVADHLGTPTHLIDPTTLDIAGQAHSTLWGQTTWTGHTTTPLRFPGQYHDPETGLHYNHHRYYQPTTGRYATPDPLGLTPAPNPHTYPQNPTIFTDPLGLAPISACEGKKPWSPTYGEAKGPGVDSHHVIQDAAAKGWVNPETGAAYSRSQAPAVGLEGPSYARGTPHYEATQAQNRSAFSGTYGAERQVAIEALLASGKFTPQEISQIMKRADEYFIGHLGMTHETPLRVPGTRWGAR
ncbi:RHS repeat-associated core domain-containing protein [Mycobacteroides saopaulense]|nr:RHS repeat-associated core domain-containing protein [Mycobacteroides saopaulense]